MAAVLDQHIRMLAHSVPSLSLRFSRCCSVRFFPESTRYYGIKFVALKGLVIGTFDAWTGMDLKASFFFPDNTAFKFDGDTAVELPPKAFPSDIGNQFTLSLWVKTAEKRGKQAIFATGDKTRLDRIHLAIMTKGKQLLFTHRQGPGASRDLFCKSHFHYKPNIFDKQWHHLAFVVDGCSTKLYVDGEYTTATAIDSNWTLHKSTIPSVTVVGAHWLAKEKTYTQFFTGAISGLAIRPQKTTTKQVRGLGQVGGLGRVRESGAVGRVKPAVIHTAAR